MRDIMEQHAPSQHGNTDRSYNVMGASAWFAFFGGLL